MGGQGGYPPLFFPDGEKNTVLLLFLHHFKSHEMRWNDVKLGGITWNQKGPNPKIQPFSLFLPSVHNRQHSCNNWVARQGLAHPVRDAL